MADISDVLTAMVAAAQTAVYPSGTSSPSIAGVDGKLYAGWPVPVQLDADLAAGKWHITFWARPEVKNLRKYRPNMNGQAVGGNQRNEMRRQERSVQVSVWTAAPAIRDRLGAAVSAYLDLNQRITCASGEVAFIRYQSEVQVDDNQKTNIYRRDVILTAEFPTSHDTTATAVTTPVTTIATNL